MMIVSCERLPGRRGKVRIRLSDGRNFCLYPGELSAFAIEEGRELSDETYQKLLDEILIPRAKKRAMHLIAKADRSERSLRDKLTEGGYPPEACDAAIAFMKESRFLDDLEYACSYVRTYQESRSRRRIFDDLRGKGVPEDMIEQALSEYYESDEREMIRALLQKRGYDRDRNDPKERAKMYRYLSGRGFSYSDFSDLL